MRALAEDVNVLTASVHAELAERRRAEAAAKASERSYRLLFQDNPSPMYVYDLESGILVAVNDTALALYGYARDEFVGMPVEDLIAPAEMARLRSTVGNLRSGLRSGLSNSGIWQHRRSDGSELDGRDHRDRPCLRRARGPRRAGVRRDRARRGGTALRRQRGSLPRPVRERKRPDRDRRPRRPRDGRERGLHPRDRLQPRRAARAAPRGPDSASESREALERGTHPEARRRRGHRLRARAAGARRQADPDGGREQADLRGRQAGRHRGDLPRHQRAQASSRSSCARRRSSRRSGGSPAASPTTSTTS